MKTSIVYFHGFNSSPNSTKVEKLRTSFPDLNVFAFSIDINPLIAEANLIKQIKKLDGQLIFIGTSLGGWWASRLQQKVFHNALVFLINPAYSPRTQLPKIDSSLSKEILDRYEDMVFCENHFYFISLFDQVIPPNLKVLRDSTKSFSTRFYRSSSHRFDEPDQWSDFIKNLQKIISINSLLGKNYLEEFFYVV